MKTFEELQQLVQDWAKDKGLNDYAKQSMKVMEELGELNGAILKGNRIEEEDAFGDLLVTIIIMAKQREVDLVKELETAYNIIRDRKGKTINGSFVKSNT